MGTIQCTLAWLVQPNQKREIGRTNEATMATGRRVSGTKAGRNARGLVVGVAEKDEGRTAVEEMWLLDAQRIWHKAKVGDQGAE